MSIIQGPHVPTLQALPTSSTMRSRIKNIHMVGIGGVGMSGIAEVLLNLGFSITGSDIPAGATIHRLTSLGATVFIGHDTKNINGTDVLVKSTAINENNPEIIHAHELGIPIIPRAEMLAELMRLKTGIAVAGTHGKTTTTSLLATIFTEAGLDPTVIIGGRLNTYGSNARLGEGEYLITEADESDGSFLCLSPIITVITNVDKDHMDFYPDMTAINHAFIKFMNNIPFYGINVVCGDDPGVQRLLPSTKRPVLSYGLGKNNRLRGKIITSHLQSVFEVSIDKEPWGEVTLTHPGQHNIKNALAAIGVALEVGLDKKSILRGLANFDGVERRFENKGEHKGVLVVDDYGHHPVEIKATIDTAHVCYPKRRLVVAFQPHRFTRTQALFGDFCKVFENVDLLLLTEIYPASETPIPGVNGLSLAHGIKQMSKIQIRFFPDSKAMEKALPEVLKAGDLFMTLGAGDIWQVGEHWLKISDKRE